MGDTAGAVGLERGPRQSRWWTREGRHTNPSAAKAGNQLGDVVLEQHEGRLMPDMRRPQRALRHKASVENVEGKERGNSGASQGACFNIKNISKESSLIHTQAGDQNDVNQRAASTEESHRLAAEAEPREEVTVGMGRFHVVCGVRAS